MWGGWEKAVHINKRLTTQGKGPLGEKVYLTVFRGGKAPTSAVEKLDGQEERRGRKKVALEKWTGK